jgi:hypothetical protein
MCTLAAESRAGSLLFCDERQDRNREPYEGRCSTEDGQRFEHSVYETRVFGIDGLSWDAFFANPLPDGAAMDLKFSCHLRSGLPRVQDSATRHTHS